VWVSGETVLHFDGSVWTDEGGGGPTIWGASSGDMWTGNGAHLESGVWVQYAGEGTGFDLVIGSNAGTVFFRGAGADPRNYFFDGQTFGPARGMSNALDIWPNWQSYWFVGKLDHDLGQENLATGWPADTASRPGGGYLEWGPEPDPIYKSSGATLLQKVGDAYLPVKTFDSVFTGSKAVAYADADIWVCVGGKVQHNDGEDWIHLGVDCDALQVDGDGRLWVLTSGSGTERVRVYDGRAWQTLPTPVGFVARDLAARFHEAWVLGTTTALRRSGDHWDEYRLGVDAKSAPKVMNISQDGILTFDYPNLFLATTFAH
jgi:hypothetical protein